MRTLVTGGAGFIGSAVCRKLASLPGYEVLNIDKMTYAASHGSVAELNGRDNYRFVGGDICDRALLDEVFAAFRPDGVIHLAAESHVDRSISDSDAFIQTNIVGTHTLLQATRAYLDASSPEARDAFRFLHVSTDEVYGSLEPQGSFTEITAYDPRSPYSASKAAANHLVSAWGHTYGLPVLISNCSNNYGPYQAPEKLIPLVILNALEGDPLPVYGDGKNIRDWLHVDDHVQALRLILETGAPGRTYNVGGRNERSNLDVVESICEHVDAFAPKLATGPRHNLVTFVADRPGHDRRYAIDATRIETELGWRASHSFDTGLRDTVKWYIENRSWWTPLRAAMRARQKTARLDKER